MKEERRRISRVQSLSWVHDFNSSFLFYVQYQDKVGLIKINDEPGQDNDSMLSCGFVLSEIYGISLHYMLMAIFCNKAPTWVKRIAPNNPFLADLVRMTHHHSHEP